MRTMTTDVAIIGGGVIGCGIAYYLAKQGVDTVVLEADAVAAEGSGRSFGALRSQGRDLHELPLAIESNKTFPGLNDEFGYDTEYRRNGHIIFVYSEEAMYTIESMYKRQEDYGYKVSKMVSPEEIYKIVPQFPRELAGGMYCPIDGHCNPMRLTKGYSIGAKKWGAKILTQTPVKKINVSGGRVVSVDAGDLTVKANKVLNVTGIHAKEISKTVGIDLPIACLIFEIMVTEPLPHFLDPVILCPERKFGMRQTANGNILMGSSVPNDLTTDMTMIREKIKERVKLMLSIFPKQLKDISIIRSFAGLYDITPDLLPIMHRFENPAGYYVIAGFSGHGLAIAPSVGNRIAEWIITGELHKEYEQFSFSRFEGYDIPSWGTQKGKYSFHAWPTKQKTSN
jgi:sarcosine oxidase subunit beta